MIYLDSSALVKRYVREDGSQALAERLAKEDLVATSRVAQAEVAAAIARRCRERSLSVKERDRLITALESDLLSMLVVEVTAQVLRPVGRLVRAHPLRGFDAVHVACALALVPDVTFASADLNLNSAAAAAGLSPWFPTDRR